MVKRLKLVGGCTLACAALVLLAAHYINPERIRAAPGLKTVQPFPAAMNHPAVVTKITLGNAVVQKGIFVKGPVRKAADLPTTPFQAGDDWIENLTVYLLNRTDKAIVHGFINFTFPEVASVYRLELGNIPTGFAFTREGRPFVRPAAPPFWFGPKQVVAIRLSDHIDQIRAMVEPRAHMPLSRLSQMHVNLANLDFEDGMEWGGATYQVMDPATHTWRSMAPSYFPGNMDLYWPGRPGWIEPE